MRKKSKLFLLLVLLVILGIQFIPIHTPTNEPIEGKSIIEISEVPNKVADILIRSCFDCHSQQGTYPWYSYIAPVSWLVNRDVNNGREELDFSFWADLSKRKQLGMLNEIATEVDEMDMPMPIYVWMHPDAKLSDEDRKLIIDWTEQFAEDLF